MTTMAHPFSSEEREILRHAFLRLIPHSEVLAISLYSHLFEIAPETRALFPIDMEKQHDAFVAMLAQMIDALENEGEMEAACRASGDRHRGYGVKPEHYVVLDQALRSAIHETCEPLLKPIEIVLLAKLYENAARLMQE